MRLTRLWTTLEQQGTWCDRVDPPDPAAREGDRSMRAAPSSVLTVCDAAEVLDLNANQIWALLTAGKLPAVRLRTGGWRIRISDLEQLLTDRPR